MKNSFTFVSDEDGEKSVSVLLDAEESELIFLDQSLTVSFKNKNFYHDKHINNIGLGYQNFLKKYNSN